LSDPQYPFALPIGTQISGYEIVRVLGVGGFGITYEGFNPVTRRRAAIKEFFPRGIASRENATQVVFSGEDTDVVSWALERFRRSTTELCDFTHPNIVTVLNYVPANETGYMFMEQVDGETLEQWLQRKDAAVAFEEVRAVLDPICEALEYVHARKFIHRDIAPDNIMIRKDGRPMLIDFGAIKIIAQQAQTRAATGRSYGVAKQHYSPPEQLDDEAELDPRADVYALGAVLYRAVSGAPPVDSDKRKSDLVLKGADPYLSAAQTARIPLPHSVVDIIDRSLSLKPAERPSSIAEFRAALKDDGGNAAVVAPTRATKVQPMPTPGFSNPGAKVAAPTPTPAAAAPARNAPPRREPSEMSPRSNRSWIGIAAIATVVLIIIGVLVASFTSQSPPVAKKTEPQKQQQKQTTQPAATALAAVQRAEKLASDGNHRDAVASYSEALRLAGNDNALRASALKGRAASNGELNQYAEQVADLTEAIRLEPNDPDNYAQRSHGYYFMKEYDRAISDQTRAIQMNSRSAYFYSLRGRTNLAKKDYIAAVADYSDAIRLSPQTGLYYAGRGAAHGYRNDFPRALNDYAEAIKLVPNQPNYLRERADIYVGRADSVAATRTDDLNRAKADLDSVIRGNSVMAADYEKRGLILEKLGNRAAALADFREAIKRDANRPLSRQAIQRLGG
jgi:serine/threonine protein kinase/regulator of sirC expression with transglutaminase-like and TPR domain